MKTIILVTSDDEKNIQQYDDYIITKYHRPLNILGKEIEYVGKQIGEFLRHEEMDVLSIWNPVEDLSKILINFDFISDIQFKFLRIYLGEGICPEGYDQRICPYSGEGFAKRMDYIIEMENKC
jgi:hypothetical protein